MAFQKANSKVSLLFIRTILSFRIGQKFCESQVIFRSLSICFLFPFALDQTHLHFVLEIPNLKEMVDRLFSTLM